MKVALALAVAAILAIAAGCGDESPAEQEERVGSALDPVADGGGEPLTGQPSPDAPSADPGSTPRGAESGRSDRSAAGAGQDLPTGVPLDAKDPRVQKALADLLNPPKRKPPRSGAGGGGAEEDGIQAILKELVQGGRKQEASPPQEESPPPEDRPSKSGDAGLQAILDQLK